MVEMVERNGHRWAERDDDPDGDNTVKMILAAAAGHIDEPKFITWVEIRLRPRQPYR